MPIDAKQLQRRLGVPADGIIGRGTLTALFQKAGAPLDRAQELALAANVCFAEAGIMDNEKRLAHLMAQLIHESDSFKAMEEYASGKAYEGRADLGNTQPGDGPRYKGHGPIQITGRANHRLYGQLIGVDLERRPELASVPSIGIHTACAYWTRNGLNALADRDDLVGITKRINGGTNGLAARQSALAKMKALVA